MCNLNSITRNKEAIRARQRVAAIGTSPAAAVVNHA